MSSVNKMLRSLSNAGRGFCVGRARVSREVWVSDFAMSGWVEMAQIRGYLPPGTVWGNLSFLFFYEWGPCDGELGVNVLVSGVDAWALVP